MIKTRITEHYRRGLILRVTVFVLVFLSYLTYKEQLYGYLLTPLYQGVAPMHVLWFIFMITMITHLFPNQLLSMALRKNQEETYREVPGYSQLALLQQVQQQNLRAWYVMLVWLCFNAIFGLLYLFHVIDNADLLMLTVFYYLCDYICILFYCPFQSVLMKNKCCVNCRIYDWGHFMMFTPMLFIKDFFSWSLFFTSVIVLIHWEIIYARHPERFWSGSNQILQCSSCQDKHCQMKKKLRSIVIEKVSKNTDK